MGKYVETDEELQEILSDETIDPELGRKLLEGKPFKIEHKGKKHHFTSPEHYEELFRALVASRIKKYSGE
jgi:YHS domain-containing protein